MTNQTIVSDAPAPATTGRREATATVALAALGLALGTARAARARRPDKPNGRRGPLIAGRASRRSVRSPGKPLVNDPRADARADALPRVAGHAED